MSTELGEPIREFSYRGSRAQLTWLFLAIPFLLFTIPAFLTDLPLGFAIVPAAIGGVLLAVAMLQNPKVGVFTNGLRITNGARVQVCLWSDVQAFWQQLSVGQATLAGVAVVKGPTMHQYRIRRSDGREFKFAQNFKNIAELGELIRIKVFPGLLAACRAALERGEVVEFGTIWLNREQMGQYLGRARQGQARNSRSFPWAELKEFDLRIEEGLLRIDKGREVTRGGENFDAILVIEPIGNIPNFNVLLALLATRLTLPEWARSVFHEIRDVSD